MMNLYVMNLGKYTEGKIVGDWITLPTSEEQLQTFLTEVVQLNERYEEYLISDVEKKMTGIEIPEHASLVELNKFLQQVETLSEDEKIVLEVLMDNDCYYSEHWMNALEKVKEGNWRLFMNCPEMSDVAKEVFLENVTDSIPDFVLRHFDYESYGEELETSNTYYGSGDNYVLFYQE